MNTQTQIEKMSEEEAMWACDAFLRKNEESYVCDEDPECLFKNELTGCIIQKLIEWKCWFRWDESYESWKLVCNPSSEKDARVIISQSLFKAFLLTANRLGKYEPPKPKEELYYMGSDKIIYGPYNSEEQFMLSSMRPQHCERVRVSKWEEE